MNIFKKFKFGIQDMVRDFNQKIWMTIGLGVTFFGLYLCSIFSLAYFIDLYQAGSTLFALAYERPLDFVYLALFAVAFISFSIWLVRLFIKYLYLTWNWK